VGEVGQYGFGAGVGNADVGDVLSGVRDTDCYVVSLPRAVPPISAVAAVLGVRVRVLDQNRTSHGNCHVSADGRRRLDQSVA
jgi:hypothetical protein